MIFHIVLLLIFKYLFNKPVEVLIVILYQALYIWVLGNHRLYILPKFLIFKH